MRLAEVAPIGGPVTVPGHAGAVPNFYGDETDVRLVELWLRDKSPATRKAYAQEDLKRFFDFSGGKPLSSVTHLQTCRS